MFSLQQRTISKGDTKYGQHKICPLCTVTAVHSVTVCVIINTVYKRVDKNYAHKILSRCEQ